ncbi:Ferredoxin--NAD(P)(+) reductase CarAd [Roseivivax jejudonensis]|uniref:Ferredoxin--NAD(P)(+) reductase CarAd n=1 Tax=Roseivivax jejudonensis TaxID=1529041 RepID=A0A1X6ZXJ5_9RHOB|nr:2Fe-2S iron-sulfur cluster binding domain-containing protein [Roseivivax jejudonensis]SLN64288.1 Ferredoxin--NAD(P)(+) reductase CarAd [Roseivivax jejudonensis]
MPTITLQSDGTQFECAPGDTILRAALRAGLGVPYSCNVGECGNCKFQLIKGEVRHTRDDPPAWSEKKDLKRGRWLGCQAEPLVDCVIKLRPDPEAVSRDRPALREAELLSATPVAHDLTEFSFRIDGADGFRPGQYALIGAPGITGGRAYSMSNLPGDGTWDFIVKRKPGGAVTAHLFDTLEPGGTVTLDGPYGTAWLREDSPRDIVLLAGGSGLSPMVSIARGADAAGMLGDRRIHLLYGARSEADLFDPATVLGGDLAPKVTVTTALMEPSADWSGATGLLPDVARDTLGDALAACELYFAGPAAMSQAVQLMAHEAGLPPERMHFDEFY